MSTLPPHPLALSLCRDHALPERTAFFVPVHGLGDKLRFYSYLPLFQAFNACEARVVFASDFDHGLLACYPELQARALRVAPELLRALFAEGQVLAGAFSPAPGPLQVFPTWHRAYLHEPGIRWEALDQPGVTHDLLIKQILHVPPIYAPAPIALPARAPGPRPTVLLAPYNVSNRAADCAVWLEVAEQLTAAGAQVLCNVAKGGRPLLYPQDYSALFERYACLDASLEVLLEQLAGLAGVVSIRSGLSDVVSLSEVPAVTLSHGGIGRFWDVPNPWGRHLQLDVDAQSPAALAHACVDFLRSRWTR